MGSGPVKVCFFFFSLLLKALWCWNWFRKARLDA